MSKWTLVFALFGLIGCSKDDPSNRLYGVVNGRVVRGHDIESRLKKSLDELESAPSVVRELAFRDVAREMVVEDEISKTSLSRGKLLGFLDLIAQYEITPAERAGLLKDYPDLGSLKESDQEAALQSLRRSRLEKRYIDQLMARSTVRFLYGQEKQAKVLGIKD